MIIYTASKRNILLIVCFFISLSIFCFYVPELFNKITTGTLIISIYESIFFYILSFYYLIQLLPGFCQLLVDDFAIKETWFFKTRIYVKFSNIKNPSDQTFSGDSLYLYKVNNTFLSSRKITKGIYNVSQKLLLNKVILLINSQKNKDSDKQPSYYLVLKKIKSPFIIIVTLLFIFFNSYNLSQNSIDSDFKDQITYWQSGDITSEELFNLLKVYGVYWKLQLKQIDRKFYHEMLYQESLQIETALLNKYTKSSLDRYSEYNIKVKIQHCRDKFLNKEGDYFYKCLGEL